MKKPLSLLLTVFLSACDPQLLPADIQMPDGAVYEERSRTTCSMATGYFAG